MFRTKRSPADILERLQAYAEEENARIRALIQAPKMGRLKRWANDGKPRAVTQYYDLLPQGNTIYVAFAWIAQRILDGDQNWQRQGAWLARLTLEPVNETTTTTIRIVLVGWTTDGNNGQMQNRSWYENPYRSGSSRLPTWLVQRLYPSGRQVCAASPSTRLPPPK